MKQVKVNNKFNANHLPCTPQYFEENIKDKPLSVIKRYRSMIRVKDQLGEEWSLFKKEYIVCTGL